MGKRGDRNMDNILTVDQKAKVENRVKDSKFVGHIKSVEEKSQAKKFIDDIKEQYNKASHNVSAFKLGIKDEALKYSDDDGEPAGSSGPPVLQAIEGENLTNTVVVVTRYFGGTKLGIGGLIRAYGDTARKVIKKSGIKKLQPVYKLRILGSYDIIGGMLSQVESVRGKILSTEYTNHGGQVYFLLPCDKYDILKEKLIEVTGNEVEIEKVKKMYI